MFRVFLEQMLASESIDFWNAVEVFRKVSLENPAKLYGRAMAIYDQYPFWEGLFLDFICSVLFYFILFDPRGISQRGVRRK